MLAVARGLRLPADERELAAAARLADVGKIGLPDSVLQKPGSLDGAEWDLLAEHPAIGAAMLEELPELAALAPVVRAHHERWDGQGYPDGLEGERIPVVSRIISACDAFVAMTSERSFRSAMDRETALAQIHAGAGTQFDPRVAEALAEAVLGDRRPAVRGGTERTAAPAGADGAGGPHGGSGQRPSALPKLIEAVRPIPALQSALDAFAEGLAGGPGQRGALIGIIERDPGLAVGVVRAAGERGPGDGIATVAEAFDLLDHDDLLRIAAELPARDFVWARAAADAALEAFRLHAVTTQRAALRIAASMDHIERDQLALAALLHDVGKFALAQFVPNYPGSIRERARSADQAVQLERRLLRFDHATVGGLLARRWSLAEPVAEAIGQHHAAEDGSAASVIRLADALAHHAQGAGADADRVLHLGKALGLGPEELRAIMFELPHSGGSQRPRATPSPLSKREADVLRGLAGGKVYKQIAADLGLSASTVRTHVHKTYAKLGAADRAQAVLIASDRGWL